MFLLYQVRLVKDAYFPADLLLLTTETAEGLCYIETMNLDGETNLKIKSAPDETKGWVGGEGVCCCRRGGRLLWDGGASKDALSAHWGLGP